MIYLLALIAFTLGFVFGYFTGAESKPKHTTGDYDGDGQAYTNKDLGVFQSRRNRLQSQRKSGK